jgi:hypothetical protein
VLPQVELQQLIKLVQRGKIKPVVMKNHTLRADQ